MRKTHWRKMRLGGESVIGASESAAFAYPSISIIVPPGHVWEQHPHKSMEDAKRHVELVLRKRGEWRS